MLCFRAWFQLYMLLFRPFQTRKQFSVLLFRTILESYSASEQSYLMLKWAEIWGKKVAELDHYSAENALAESFLEPTEPKTFWSVRAYRAMDAKLEPLSDPIQVLKLWLCQNVFRSVRVNQGNARKPFRRISPLFQHRIDQKRWRPRSSRCFWYNYRRCFFRIFIVWYWIFRRLQLKTFPGINCGI